MANKMTVEEKKAKLRGTYNVMEMVCQFLVFKMDEAHAQGNVFMYDRIGEELGRANSRKRKVYNELVSL